MFRLEGVRYKNILDIESLLIPAGMVTSVVGESGSGKTTLLKLLNKLISPDRGSIFFNDKPFSEINSIELRRKVVMLSQSPAIFPGTVKHNLLIGLKFAEKPGATDQDLATILKFIHLSKDFEDDAEKLSGGEKQRLALGRVILLDPQVFMLDEPSSSLDEETEKLVMDKLVSHSRQKGKTLIMVTHAKKIAQAYSDKIIEIKNGREAVTCRK
ncbi:MAG: ATP-binding cassette domain-containing protein [Clostridiales bacterium]|nr:ATP-binding cassette domain-containing protein [Clostridiales bacterium]